MPEENELIIRRQLRTPRAAAFAGIIFGLLYGAGYALIQLSIPGVSADAVVLSKDQAGAIALGLNFLPFVMLLNSIIIFSLFSIRETALPESSEYPVPTAI